MIYGYARVSSDGQARDGNSLTSQDEALRNNGVQVVFSEHVSGKNRERPELEKLLKALGNGDTLIVTKLDRIARSTIHGVSLIEELMGRGVRINILNMGVVDSTPASKLMRTMLFAFAEFERDMIVERTSEGKAIARKRPEYKEGRPKVSINEKVLGKLKELQDKGKITASEAAEKLGISRSKYYELKSAV